MSAGVAAGDAERLLELLKDGEQVVRGHDEGALGVVLEPDLAELLDVVHADAARLGADVGKVLEDHSDHDGEHDVGHDHLERKVDEDGEEGLPHESSGMRARD